MQMNESAHPDTLPRRLARAVLWPILQIVASIYFVLDAIFVGLLAPVVTRIAGAPIFRPLAAWVMGLGPYPTLVLFLIPILALEPLKPLGAWLIATGKPMQGLAVLVGGEVAKIVIVERLYHACRDKLLSIPLFARAHGIVVRIIDRIRAAPPVAATLAALEAIRSRVRNLWRQLRAGA